MLLYQITTIAPLKTVSSSSRISITTCWAKQLCYWRYGSDETLAFQRRAKHVQNRFRYPQYFLKEATSTRKPPSYKIGFVLFVVPVSTPGLGIGFFFSISFLYNTVFAPGKQCVVTTNNCIRRLRRQ